MEIDVFQGDICGAPAEIICTSTNPHLDLTIGTGGAVSARGGPTVQAEAHAAIRAIRGEAGPRYLPAGSAVRTGAGELPFRAVIHCVAIDAFHDSSEEIISACVRSALERVREMSPPATSLALPVLATGGGKFNFHAALAVIVRELSAGAPESLNHVLIVTPDAGMAERIRQYLNHVDR